MIFASSNQNKINQVKQFVKSREIIGLKEAGIFLDVVEDGLTLEENAIKKVKAIYEITKNEAIADDSGLFIPSLDNFPGVQTRRFLGDDASDSERNEYLIDKLKNKSAKEKKCSVKCAIAYINKLGDIKIFNGEFNSYIADSQMGDNFFGFDSIVYADKKRTKTLAQLSDEEKLKINARSIALQKFESFLKTENLDWLIKDEWSEKDFIEIEKFLESLKNPIRLEWTKNLLNTNLEVLALTTPVVKSITNKIMQGNYLSYLKGNLCKYYDEVAINGFIISKIKDFDLWEKCLETYLPTIDCWATCDLLSFNITKDNSARFLELAKKLIKSSATFDRRVGFNIMLARVELYIDDILVILRNYTQEKEYYVNMMISWLVAECFIKEREKTLELLKDKCLNDFVQNKSIQKIRDSFRVSKSDKEMLLKYKK